MSDNRRSLPNDLIIEILLKLPAKSLVRLRSTCKTWNSLIKNPWFAKSHFHYHQYLSSQNLSLLLSYLFSRSDTYVYSLNLNLNLKEITNNEVQRHFLSLALPFDTTSIVKGYRPLGSCNGLVCLHALGANIIIVWNPVTNEYRSIRSPIDGYGICRSGFGFASSINDYKIMLVVGWDTMVYHRWESESFIYVYSCKKNEWRLLDFDVAVNGSSLTSREINYVPYNYYYAEIQEAIQLNEALHWIVGPCYSSIYFILKFDLVNEVFERTDDLSGKIIKKDIRGSVNACVGITRRNKLCVCHTISDYKTPTSVEVWMMEGCDNQERHESSWRRLFRHRGDWQYLGDEHRLLKITTHGRVMIMEKKRTNMDFMLILDATQNKLKYVQVNNKYTAPHKRGDDFVYSISYVETLISPDSVFELNN